MPQQLCEVFAIVCLFCTPTYSPQLWETFQKQLSEDFCRAYVVETSKNLALHHLERLFQQHGRRCDDLVLPKHAHCNFQHYDNTYNVEEEREKGMQAYQNLNKEQKQITDDILL